MCGNMTNGEMHLSSADMHTANVENKNFSADILAGTAFFILKKIILFSVLL